MYQLSDAGVGNGGPTTKAASGVDVFAQSIADARHLCNLMLSNCFIEAKTFIQPMCVQLYIVICIIGFDFRSKMIYYVMYSNDILG